MLVRITWQDVVVVNSYQKHLLNVVSFIFEYYLFSKCIISVLPRKEPTCVARWRNLEWAVPPL